MPIQDLDILVLLRETADPRPPAKAIARGAAISSRGLRLIPNPADLAALEEALCLKESFGAKVTVLAVGAQNQEDHLRLAISMGADRAIRCWEHGMEGADAVAQARLLARIVAVLKPTLVFSGNRLADRGDDPAPALAAAYSDSPCITQALTFFAKAGEAVVMRKGDRGARQSVTAPYPCTVLFEEERTPRYPSTEAVLASLEASIEHWKLADLALPFWKVGATGSLLPQTCVGTPRPDPVRVVTPDATLPAFERILSLLSGGIKAREGRVQSLSPAATAAALWDLFRGEGVAPEGASQ